MGHNMATNCEKKKEKWKTDQTAVTDFIMMKKIQHTYNP